MFGDSRARPIHRKSFVPVIVHSPSRVQVSMVREVCLKLLWSKISYKFWTQLFHSLCSEQAHGSLELLRENLGEVSLVIGLQIDRYYSQASARHRRHHLLPIPTTRLFRSQHHSHLSKGPLPRRYPS